MRNFMSGPMVTRDADTGTGTGGDGQQQTVVPKWYDGADAETIGHIQNKGWGDLDPGKAALAAIQSHREAEKFVGAPAERLIKLPATPDDEPGWKAVHSRLGVPDDAKDYDFSDIKDAETGEPLLEAAEQDWLRATAHKLNIPKAAAVQLAQELLKHNADIDGSESAERTAKLAEEHKALDANWGANKEANTYLARKGAEKLGLDAAAVDGLEKVVGYAKVMEALRKVGEISGEAKFITGSGQTKDGIMTREQATARKAELMNDPAWTKRYMEGGAAEAREMTALLTLIVGDDTYESAGR